MTRARVRRATIAFVALVLVLVAVGVWIARVDLPRLLGPVKGDEATYVAMALSLAKDGDLKYRAEDYRRFVSLYGTGPEGIFLKESQKLSWHLGATWPPVRVEKTPAPVDAELDYAKPFAYSVAAAPFVAVVGLNGLLLFNLLLLAASAGCAIVFCRARTRPLAGTVLGLAFVFASVAPVYAVWLTPEMFNFALVLIGLFLWLYKEVAPPTAPAWIRHPALDWIAAACLGVATFSKPPNAVLIAPLVLVAWLRGQWRRGVLLAAMFGIVAGGLFGANELISGDWNYQGGNRSSFYTHFPFDPQGTSFASGNPMSTGEVNDEHILAPEFLLPTLEKNVVYFFVGRDSGVIPYFFPGALILLIWLLRVRRATVWQWACVLACGLGALALLIFIPRGWNGAGGPIGNRYLLSLYPALLFLVPAGTGLAVAAASLAGGVVFLGAILLHPVASSHAPWINPERWPLHELPVEFTLINDIPVFLNPQRGRVLVSKDPEVFLYYMDGNTYLQEPHGFWVAPGTADIVVRTAEPLTGLDLQLSSRVPNHVEIAIDGRRADVSLRPGEASTVQLRPDPGVNANGYQVLLRITTAAGFYPRDFDPASTDTRHLGVFIEPTYRVR